MWEVIAIIAPLILSVNALLFKRLDGIEERISDMTKTYVTRDELVAKFETIDYKLEALAERIQVRHDMAELERQAEEARWRWYNSRAIPRKPKGSDGFLDGSEIEER